MSMTIEDSAPHLTDRAIEDFLQDVGTTGVGAATVKRYRSDLIALQRYLGPDADIHSGTLLEWAADMHSQGYAPRSITARVLTANRFLLYVHRPDLCREPPQYATKPEPSLTWAEYQSMLAMARLQGRLREILFMQIFVETGITTQALQQVTAESIAAGCFTVVSDVIRFSPELQIGLEHYIKQNEIQAGPVFVTRGNKPADRDNIRIGIQLIARDSGLDQAKATPRSLQKLHRQYINRRYHPDDRRYSA